MKTVNFNQTILLPLFQEVHSSGFFNQSITGGLSLHSLLITHLACVWRAGSRSLSLHGTVSQGCPAKKMTSFIDKNASLSVTHPISLG